MSGAVAVGALVVVVELGAPVASNLGLSVGLPSVGHGGIASPALGNPNFPTLGTSTTSLEGSPLLAPAVPSPTDTHVAAYDVSTVAPSETSSGPGVSPAPTSGAGVLSHVASPAAATALPSASSASAGAQASVLEHAQTTLGGGQGGGQQSSQGGGDGHAGGAAHAQGDEQGHGGGQGGGNGHGNGGNGGNGNHGGSH